MKKSGFTRIKTNFMHSNEELLARQIFGDNKFEYGLGSVPVTTREYLDREPELWGVCSSKPLFYEPEVKSWSRNFFPAWRQKWGMSAHFDPFLGITELAEQSRSLEHSKHSRALKCKQAQIHYEQTYSRSSNQLVANSNEWIEFWLLFVIFRV